MDTPESYYPRAKRCFESQEYWKSLNYYNIAILFCNKNMPDDYLSLVYNGRGLLYYTINEPAKALADYDKAIELDKNNADAHYNRGYYHYNETNNDMALIDFNKAIEQYKDTANAEAHYYRGDIFNKKRDFLKALDDYKKAARLFFLEKNYFAAWKTEKKVSDTYGSLRREWATSFKDLDKENRKPDRTKDTTKDGTKDTTKIEDLKKRINDIKKALPKSMFRAMLKSKHHANIKLDQLKENIEEENIYNDIHNESKSYTDFICDKALSRSATTPTFTVLRRWNSYTPIIADNENSKGGGYFFKTPSYGIVIDPGLNFINNFKTSGYYFHEIDHILITHAHNDHTADLESILTLLFEYNENILGDFYNPDDGTIMKDVLVNFLEQNIEKERIKIEGIDAFIETNKKAIIKSAKEELLKSSRRKRIRIYMTKSTYKKYAPMLDLYEQSDYDVILIKAGDTLSIRPPNSSNIKSYNNIIIRAINAKHSDLLSDRDSLGFILQYNSDECEDGKHGKFVLVYTGDTGYSAEIDKQYCKIRRTYAKCEIILLAHIGGFMEHEKRFNPLKNRNINQQFFYKNHLGWLGLASIIDALKPKLCIISEFGEEFKNKRLKLIEIFEKVYRNDKIKFVAADIGLRLNTNYEIELIDYAQVRDGAKAPELDFNYYSYRDTETCQSKTQTALAYYRRTSRKGETIDPDTISEILVGEKNMRSYNVLSKQE